MNGVDGHLGKHSLIEIYHRNVRNKTYFSIRSLASNLYLLRLPNANPAYAIIQI